MQHASVFAGIGGEERVRALVGRGIAHETAGELFPDCGLDA
ncbi:MAG: hypothetical protein ABIN37_01115 [Burkholderiaceae bacterium]